MRHKFSLIFVSIILTSVLLVGCNGSINDKLIENGKEIPFQSSIIN